MEGYILLHRKIIDNPYYFSEPFTRSQAWIDLLLIANYKDAIFYKRGVKVEVGRGQVGYDSGSLAERWQWSRGKVLRFLIELEKEQQIVQQKNNVTTLISIVNYNIYQIGGTADSTPNGTASSTANGQQTDTNNKGNKGKGILKEIYSPIFEKFWEQYNRKGSKSEAWKEWKGLRIESNENVLMDMFSHVERYKASTERQFMKDADRYLKYKYWEGK